MRSDLNQLIKRLMTGTNSSEVHICARMKEDDIVWGIAVRGSHDNLCCPRGEYEDIYEALCDITEFQRKRALAELENMSARVETLKTLIGQLILPAVGDIWVAKSDASYEVTVSGVFGTDIEFRHRLEQTICTSIAAFLDNYTFHCRPCA